MRRETISFSMWHLRVFKVPLQLPARCLTEEFRQEGREKHTQGKFVPEAMKLSPSGSGRRKVLTAGQRHGAAGRTRRRSPGAPQLDASNTRRKPAARGRASHFIA